MGENMSQRFWFTTAPLALGKAESAQIDGESYRTFTEAKNALLRELQRNIWAYESWILHAKEDIRFVMDQEDVFEGD
jgi:hypothetical protein